MMIVVVAGWGLCSLILLIVKAARSAIAQEPKEESES